MSCFDYNADPIGSNLCRIQEGAYQDAIITHDGLIADDFENRDHPLFSQYIGVALTSCFFRNGKLEILDSRGGGTTFDRKGIDALGNLPGLTGDRVKLSLFANEPGTVCLELGDSFGPIQEYMYDPVLDYLNTTSHDRLSTDQQNATVWALKALDRSLDTTCYLE